MSSFTSILVKNRNYRYTWIGQAISEVGDHFNTIAVLSLTLHITGSPAAVGKVMLARVIPALIAGPFAGLTLDRLDRRKVMLASDIFRGIIALLHIVLLSYPKAWLLYTLSGLLMFASPFFTSGRSAILPRIASDEELHAANALTQTTSWITLTLGVLIAGISTDQFGYGWAFVVNAGSFVASGLSVWMLKSPTGDFRPNRFDANATKRPFQGWHEFRQGLGYMTSRPLILAIGLCSVGWASGGGAAQILFSLYGEIVYGLKAKGIGLIWGAAGVGLVLGGIIAHRMSPRLHFAEFKRLLTISFVIHGLSYILFAMMPTVWWAMFFIAISRVSMGFNNVLNRIMLLTHVPDGLRGRVFTTVESMMNATMMMSMALASWATAVYPIRTIGVVAGILSSFTAVFWAWADASGKLVEPPREPDAGEMEIKERVTPV